jgi:hypothetical protein
MSEWPSRSKSTPASCRALDNDAVVAALTASRVNVSQAARTLGIPSGDLRRALAVVPPLLDLVIEIDEERIDLAQQNVDEMLRSDDKLLRKEASFFVLRQSRRAASRGWRQPDAEVNVNANVRMETVRIRWANGEELTRMEVPVNELPPMIEHDPVERARIEEERLRIAEEREGEEERRRQGDQDSG